MVKTGLVFYATQPKTQGGHEIASIELEQNFFMKQTRINWENKIKAGSLMKSSLLWKLE